MLGTADTAKVPGGQDWHADAFRAPASSWYVPAGQARHPVSSDGAPSTPRAPCVAGGQSTQASLPVARDVGWYVPAGHRVQLLPPSVAAYDPGAQEMQSLRSVRPSSADDVPAGHGRH